MQPDPSPFSEEIETLMRQIETERIAREELARLDAWLDTIEAPPLTDQDVELCMQRIYAWLNQEQAEEDA